MKPLFSFRVVILSLVPALAPAGTVAFSQSGKSVLEMPRPVSPWSFGVGYAPMFQVSAEYEDLGGVAPVFPAPPAGVPTFGEYDDGFVRPDISGSPGLTSYWSYLDGAQHDPAGGGSLALSTTEGLANARGRENGRGALGIELSASRPLGGWADGRAEWGVQFRLNYARLDIGDASAMAADAFRTTDSFPLNGVIPPLAPYSGSFTGPGPLLSTSATRSTTLLPGGSLVTGTREVEAHLLTLGAGPWLAWSPAERWWIQLEAGLSLALADGRYRHRSVATLPGGATQTSSGSGGETSLLPGLYAGASLIHRLDEHWDIYLSARYQYLDDFSVRAGGSRAELSFDKAVVLGAGVRFRF